MHDTIYYHAYKSRADELLRGGRRESDQPAAEDSKLQEILHRDLQDRRSRNIPYANQLGFSDTDIVVEAFQDTLPADSKFMRLIDARVPTVVVMDSLSMFLQQLNMSYWISLLRTALQNNVVPITVQEHRHGGVKDFEFARQTRLATIESLTEHIRLEPKRERGRRKLGPISDLVEEILVLSALSRFSSSTDVIEYISYWHKERTKDPFDHTLRDKIFDEERWHTYKYKVRTMVKDILVEAALRDDKDAMLPNDLWQPSIYSVVGVVSVASIAAAKALPEYGYFRSTTGWVKGQPTPQLDLDMP